MLKDLLEEKGMKSMLINSKSRLKERQKILSEWGKEFFPLLSVHTLEIGYDVPEAYMMDSCICSMAISSPSLMA